VWIIRQQAVFTTFEIGIKNQVPSLDGPSMTRSNNRVFADIANNVVILQTFRITSYHATYIQDIPVHVHKKKRIDSSDIHYVNMKNQVQFHITESSVVYSKEGTTGETRTHQEMR